LPASTSTTLGEPYPMQPLILQAPTGTYTSEWRVNISSVLTSTAGNVFSYIFPATSAQATEELIFVENYTAEVCINCRYAYTVSNESGSIIYDKMPGYLQAGHNNARWDGNLTINGTCSFPGGAMIYTNSTCLVLTSPDGTGVTEVCNVPP